MNSVPHNLRSLLLIFTVLIMAGIAHAAEKPEIFVQMGHTGKVTAVAISPDGRYALSGSVDKTLKLWDIAAGREVRTLSGATRRITSLAVSPDGKYVFSGDEDLTNNLKLWDTESGKMIRSFSGHEGGMGAVTAVAFSPEGKVALSGGYDKLIKLWDIESGKEVRTFDGSTAGITSIAVSPDGKYVIAGCRDNSVSTEEGPEGTFVQVRAKSKANTIGMWEITTGRQIKAFNTGKGWVTAIAISPDGKYVISGDYEDSTRVWDLSEGREIKAFDTQGVSSIAISPDGKVALLGGVMQIQLWDIAAGKEMKSFSGGSGWVSSVAISPDGKVALSGDDSNTPKLWDIESGKEVRAFGGYAQPVAATAIGHDGKNLLTAQTYGFLNFWDISTGRQIKTIKNTLGLKTVALGSSGVYAMAGGWDFSERTTALKLWSLESGKEIRTFKREGPYWVQSAAISPDEKSVLWSSGNTLRLSAIETGQDIKTLTGDQYEIRSMGMSDSGRYAISSDGPNLRVWDVVSERIINTFEGYQGTISFDGSAVLLMRMDAEREKLAFKLWDIPANSEIKTWEWDYKRKPQGIDELTMSRNRRWVLWADQMTLHLCDISTGREEKIFSDNIKGISSIGITPDEKKIYAGFQDGTTRLWEISSGREIARFISFTDGEWIVITPGGYFNASSNGARHLNVRVGREVYSIDNFYETFFNPVYVASVLQGRKVDTAADIRKGFAPPPEVKIISPEAHAEFSLDSLPITVSAKDSGGGIDEIRLYQNGKAIGEDRRAVKIVYSSLEITKTYTVNLVDGFNHFRAVGFSKDRTESNPYELMVRLAAPQKEVILYVLVVGINTYKNPVLNLNFAEPDARGIADFFRQKGRGLFKKVEIIGVYNEQATKQGINAKLKQLQNTQPQDAVVIYLAGHGESVGDKWYFIPHELTYPERQDEVKTKGVSSDELAGYIKDIKAQKILMLIDACKAGAVMIAFRGFEDRKALLQLSRSTGVHIIAASTKDQFAAEVKDLGHGVFTYTLLEGLKGKASGGGETVTVFKLKAFVDEQLPEITKKYKREAQYPVGDAKGMDFPLVMAK